MDKHINQLQNINESDQLKTTARVDFKNVLLKKRIETLKVLENSLVNGGFSYEKQNVVKLTAEGFYIEANKNS